MKRIIKNFVAILIVSGIVLSGCQSGQTTKEGDKDTKAKTEKTKEKKKKALSLDEKARNVYKNTLTVFSAGMFITFNSMFKGMAEGFAESFENLSEGDAKVKEIDAKINEDLPKEIMSKLDTIKMQMDEALDEIKKENPTVYNKMFKHELMKEGVEITTKYDLPKGFKPLSHDLSQTELNRYIVYISSQPQDEIDKDDPVMKTYKELFEWFQKVSQEFQKDQEIKAFMDSMKKKKN
jgi:hypothetical protein